MLNAFGENQVSDETASTLLEYTHLYIADMGRQLRNFEERHGDEIKLQDVAGLVRNQHSILLQLQAQQDREDLIKEQETNTKKERKKRKKKNKDDPNQEK
ncbi:MAG: hypothetical protein EZS28_000480 [Streblomastix strix]|uniref:Uncharacterized protein n=1 Tax=Streblomastix strix TaxID=222440 RepID=A0A5J4X9L3_9EUKA|nr:MAG: hypothetical protein EZS28_000480 [Streblomastix strix]